MGTPQPGVRGAVAGAAADGEATLPAVPAWRFWRSCRYGGAAAVALLLRCLSDVTCHVTCDVLVWLAAARVDGGFGVSGADAVPLCSSSTC